ncbi:MAG: hypothetical protein WC438_05795 [Candidatus Pacearchaeota archaeon]|jgi:hypothetical protein
MIYSNILTKHTCIFCGAPLTPKDKCSYCGSYYVSEDKFEELILNKDLEIKVFDINIKQETDILGTTFIRSPTVDFFCSIEYMAFLQTWFCSLSKYENTNYLKNILLIKDEKNIYLEKCFLSSVHIKYSEGIIDCRCISNNTIIIES